MSRRSINRVSKEQTLLYDRITKNETKIHLKLAQIKKERPMCGCKHFEQLRPTCQSFEPSNNYYEKYWKLFLLNQLCFAKLQTANEELNNLGEKVTEVEGLFEEHDQYTGGKGLKRNRRTATEVERNYPCPYSDCYKQYATEVSLNLHIKTKHNGGNKSDRDRAAEMILHARENNLPIPNFYINLPPGFVEEYDRTYRAMTGQLAIYEDD